MDDAGGCGAAGGPEFLKYHYGAMASAENDQHEAVIGRLEREREQAERRYVAALAALDAAAETAPALAESAAASERELVRLNEIWRGGAASGGGLVARVLSELGRMLPWRRRALNGAMLAAINRQAETTRAMLDATRHFQSHVIWYGQTIAGFAATRRRGATGGEGGEVMQAAINAIATDWQLRWDALQARELRYDARMASLTKAYEDLREISSLAQQSTLALKRTVEAMTSAPSTQAPTPGAAAVSPAPDPDAFKYVAFEDRYRGTTEDIRRRLLDYMPLFSDASNVLDVGCGRGELLQLFKEHGVSARGIDINDEMVTLCRSRGLTADRADAVAFLSSQPPDSLGGLIAIQVVEHLEPPYLMRFIDAAQRALKPGAPIVLETINAACWSAFFDSYIRDFTHARPLHPDTMRYLMQASGFSSAEIQYRSPFGEEERLPTVPLATVRQDPAGATALALTELLEALNAHAERLNARLFTHRDYAIVARK